VTRGVGYLAFLLASLVLASVARADDVPPEAVIATIPFEVSHEPNRIRLNLAQDGAPPFELWLDTGAEYSVLTPLAARRLGVVVSRTKDDAYRRATRLGVDLQFYVDTRRSDTGARTGWEYGLLGGNLLHNYVVDFDFRGRQIRFLDPKKYAVPGSTAEPEAAVVPIRAGANRPVVEIRINGRPLSVLVDTGCQAPAILSGEAAREIGIDPETLPDYGQGGTAVGPMKLRFLEAAEVEIGGMHFTDVPIKVAPHGWYGMSGETKDSVIGYDLLSRFRTRIDYPHARMWLKREQKIVPYYGVDYAATRAGGALLYPIGGGRYRVMYLFPDSPAVHLGLKSSDVVMPQTADGEVRTDAQLIEAIRTGQRIRVARKMNDTWVDLDLPDDPMLQGQGK